MLFDIMEKSTRVDKRRHGVSLAVLLAVFLLAVPARADSLEVVTVNRAPYGSLVDGKIVGVVHEIASAVVREAGFEPVETLVSSEEATRRLAGGGHVVLIMAPDVHMEQYAVNLGEVLPVETVVIGRAATPLRSLRDVRGKTLAGVRGDSPDARISRKNGMVVYPMADETHCLKMLVARRVDFALGDKGALLHAAKRLRLPRRFLGRPLVLSSGHLGLYVSRSASASTIERLKRAVEKLSEDGTLRGIREKYYL